MVAACLLIWSMLGMVITVTPLPPPEETNPVLLLKNYLGETQQPPSEGRPSYQELFPEEAEMELYPVTEAQETANAPSAMPSESLVTKLVKNEQPGTNMTEVDPANHNPSLPPQINYNVGTSPLPTEPQNVPPMPQNVFPTLGPPILTPADDKRARVEGKTGQPCQFEGNWTSESAGVKISSGLQPRSGVLNLKIETDPAWKDEPLFDPKRWLIKGEAPLGDPGPICFTALNRKDSMMANFMGECRTFQGFDTVVGIWVVGRPAIDYKDTYTSFTIIHDLLVKDV